MPEGSSASGALVPVLMKQTSPGRYLFTAIHIKKNTDLFSYHGSNTGNLHCQKNSVC
jgi:hypothetical protein